MVMREIIDRAIDCVQLVVLVVGPCYLRGSYCCVR